MAVAGETHIAKCGSKDDGSQITSSQDEGTIDSSTATPSNAQEIPIVIPVVKKLSNTDRFNQEQSRMLIQRKKDNE